MSFCHVHRHGEFSLLDAVGTAEQYALRASDMGHTSLALTDHGTLAGALYHREACHAKDLKPLMGMEAYFRPDAKQHDNENKTSYHLILLAQNKVGWHNLMRLSSESHKPENFYYRPCIDWGLLEQHAEGLIATSSCVAGYLPTMLREERPEDAEAYLLRMHHIFGDRFWLELQPHGFPAQRDANIMLLSLAMRDGIGFLATSDAHYPAEDWRDTRRVLGLLSTGSSIKKAAEAAEEDREDYLTSEGSYLTNWLSSEQEMRDQFAEHHTALPTELVDEAIRNTDVLAGLIEDIQIDRTPKVPKATGSPLEAERILREWCLEGLRRVHKTDDPIYAERLERELAVMRKLRVLDYVVIIGDMVRWAKAQGIRVGPCRGSVGGSLVAYLSRITALDPIGYGLLFERFLSESRTELPDIDIDFQPDRRDEVKNYLREKYGAERVVDVAAFQSFGMKSAIKDVCRALDIDFGIATNVSKELDDADKSLTLPAMAEINQRLATFAHDYPDAWRHACRLEGQVSRLSKHPAAVVVTDRPASELIPLMRSKDESLVTQWSERANHQLISPYGFLKIDMLVTDALSTQERTLDLVRTRHGVELDFEDPTQFGVIESPFNSEADVVEAFAAGRNLGIFQFSSRGIIGLLRDIVPEHLDHVIAANALYRPGTLSNGMAFEYAKRKNGKRWTLPHSSVAPFIGQTFGIIAYQEQVMQMAQALGDLDPDEAAVFLKIVAKGVARDREGRQKLAPYMEQFKAGCKEKGLSEDEAGRIWDAILQMTTYAFNRSHSSGYALQAYQDMWLKLRYPLEFYASLLSTELGDKVPSIIREARLQGIRIKPPDVNISDAEFTIDGETIRFGLLAVKQVGAAALVELRAKRPFKSLEHFEETVEKRKCNARVKQALLSAGCFDSFGGRDDWSRAEKSVGEREYLGYVVEQQSDVYRHRALIEQHLTPADKLTGDVEVGGEIVAVKKITTRNGHPMAFVDVEFGPEQYAVTFFPALYEKHKEHLHEGEAILVLGKFDNGSVLAEHACRVADLAGEIRKAA